MRFVCVCLKCVWCFFFAFFFISSLFPNWPNNLFVMNVVVVCCFFSLKFDFRWNEVAFAQKTKKRRKKNLMKNMPAQLASCFQRRKNVKCRYRTICVYLWKVIICFWKLWSAIRNSRFAICENIGWMSWMMSI